MDGSILEHSDSDSGESWTLLDNTPTYAEDVPTVENQQPTCEGYMDVTDKDEDTDGISIISDSEPESPCEVSYEQCTLDPPTVHSNPVVSTTHTSNSNLNKESVRSTDELLGENGGKLKIYVHRRNKRLSTVLNIIVLGSVITAAGVAIGHMWGAKNDCLHSAPSVNKILSNLYKLQEENAYLRSKLKELTLATNIQMLQRKDGYKNTRCKKVFEESLDNKNPGKLTKCVDVEYNNVDNIPDIHLTDPEYEKEFLADIDKLKNVYQQNKSWLDEEIAKRMKHESQYTKKIKTSLKSPKSIRLNDNTYAKDEGSKKRQLEAISELPRAETEIIINVTEPAALPLGPVPDAQTTPAARDKVSYADSVRSIHNIKKREIKHSPEYKTKLFNIRKRKPLQEYEVVDYMSDDDIRKDDRRVEHKFKPDRKKNDRQKINKKQKRRNKYEQWEMKGGYLKDYDDFSIASAHENDFILKNTDKNFQSRDFERNNYISQFAEGRAKSTIGMYVDVDPNLGDKENLTSKRDKSSGKDKSKDKDADWYEKRAVLRKEARKKLELELFGDSTPNNANWYFRRMQRREQCRVKGDNSTHRKLAKRAMNFKSKH